MGLADKALSLLGLQRKSALPQTWADGRPFGGAGGGEVVTASSAMALSAVWACANLVSGTIASLPFEVRRAAGKLSSAADNHPLHGVIYGSPNFEQTALDFWEYLCLSLELWGNAYARIVRSGERIVALFPIAPEAMSVRRASDGSLRYSWSENSERFEGSDLDVFHVRGPGGNPLGGMSTLQFGRKVFSAALAADQSAAATFQNGMRPSAAITFKEFMSPEQRAIAETRLVEKYVGAVNAGRPIILEGATYSQISISPEDAQMLETRQFSIEEVCRFFAVPPVMIGHSGGSTAWPTSVEQQMIAFVTYSLRRRIKRLEQAANKQLLSAKDRAAGFTTRINLDALMRGDSSARSGYYQTMIQIGAMTINEVREIENLPPVAGGDVVRLQMQNVPIGQAEA